MPVIQRNSNFKSDSIDVSLCIVNWNTVDLTSQLIESIYNTVKNLRVEILVVDNASKDGSVQYIVTRYPAVTIIENDLNVGYGPAMNQALKISTGKYIMILNSDVILLEDALEKMVTFLENNRDAGAVGPICLDIEGNISNSYGRFPRPGLMILEKILGSLTPRFIKPPSMEVKPSLNLCEKIEIEYIKGACMLVRREVCDEIGLFDERFFAYYEETDWCLRMEKRGIKRYLVSGAKIIHLYDASFSKIPAKSAIFFENSRKAYLEKHYGRPLTKIFVCANKWANFRHRMKTTLIGAISTFSKNPK